MSPDPEPLKHPSTAEDEIRAVLEQARSGDATAVPELRRVLDDHPRIWRHYGALATHVRQSWIDLIAASDLTLKESLARQVEAMKAELAGPDPSPLEKLLVERIVACWLQTCHADAAAARTEGQSKKQAEFAVKRQDSAHRRYLMAIATLALTRRLLASTVDESGRKGKLTSSSSRSRDVIPDEQKGWRRTVRGGVDRPPSENDVVLEFVPPIQEPGSPLRSDGPHDG